MMADERVSHVPGSPRDPGGQAVIVAPGPRDQKYTRGVLGVCTGSDRYPGAAVLSVEAALRTGVGMVRYLGPEPPRTLVLSRRPEAVPEIGRLQALVIGSGMDAAEAARRWAATAGSGFVPDELPVVVDAGALAIMHEVTARGQQRLGRQESATGAISRPTLITPHAGELSTLLSGAGVFGGTAPEPRPEFTRERIESDPETASRVAAETFDCVVVLKGAATVVAAPNGYVEVVPVQTHWLATAGTGDVLAGSLGALVAGAAARGSVGQETLIRCAVTAVRLHDRAARLASDGGPLVALEVAEQLSRAVAEVVRSTNE